MCPPTQPSTNSSHMPHPYRLNAREGTFALTPAAPVAGCASIDVDNPAQGIFFGRGWYPPEQHFGQVFRWAGEEAEIRVLDIAALPDSATGDGRRPRYRLCAVPAAFAGPSGKHH